jgi:soluble lytic murein transglycosylase-like protein
LTWVAVALSLMGAPDADLLTRVVQARTEAHGRTPPPQEAEALAERVRDAATTFQVPAALILAVIENESSYNPRAKSSADCRGLMQVHPNTAKRVARTLGFHSVDNVVLGTAYLATLFATYRRWDHALTAFNKGPGTFRRQNYEVSAYARKVMKRYRLLNSLLQPHLFEDS